MVCHNGRVLKPEILDTMPAELAAPSLFDLARINRLFGGHRLAQKLVGEVAAPGERFSVLDIGAAAGDTGQAIRRRFPAASITSLDRRLEHLQWAPGARVAAEAFHLPFAERSFDIVFCSLFLHHFPDSQVVELLRQFHGCARRALIVVDLLRSVFAYYFLPLTGPVMGWRPVTIYDGCISVEAAFRPGELGGLAAQAGLRGARVRRHVPWCRVSLVARRSAETGAGPQHRP
jgi:hypothetical protein